MKRYKYAVMVDTTNSGAPLVQWGSLHRTKKEACDVLRKLAFTGSTTAAWATWLKRMR